LSGYQFFGQVDVDGPQNTLTVTLRDIFGQSLFVQTLEASRG